MGTYVTHIMSSSFVGQDPDDERVAGPERKPEPRSLTQPARATHRATRTLRAARRSRVTESAGDVGVGLRIAGAERVQHLG
jgi:hypothetical protein